MANRKAALYIRTKGRFKTPPKKLVDLPAGETFYVSWYEGSRKRGCGVGRQADVAQIARLNKELELKKAAITGAPAELTPDQSQPDVKTVTVCDAVKEFLEYIDVRVGNEGYGSAKTTLQAYTRRLDRLVAFENSRESQTPITDVEQAYLEKFLKFLRKQEHRHRGKKHNNESKRRLSGRYVYNILQTTLTLLKRNGIKPGRTIMRDCGYTPKQVKAYTAEQIDAFLAACTPEEELIFQFFLFSMQREQEVSNTEVSDLVFDESILHLHSKPHRGFRLKGKKNGHAANGRKVPMPRLFMEKLREYTRDMKPGDLLFTNTQGNREGHFHRRCIAIAKRGGLDPNQFELHKFRKTGATQAYKDGVSVPIIQQWLGHVDIQTTMDYLDVSDAASAHYVDRVSNGTLAKYA